MNLSNTDRKSFLLGVGVSGAILASILAVRYVTKKSQNESFSAAKRAPHSDQKQVCDSNVARNASHVQGKVILVIGNCLFAASS